MDEFKDILICIFNYRNDANARRWFNLLSPYFDVYVLDSGNDKVCDDFIQFPNIYYSGLFNEMKKLSEKKKYKWVGIICSDVTISESNGKKLIDRIKEIKDFCNIGIYQPSNDENTGRKNWTVRHFNDVKYTSTNIIEGWFMLCRNEILANVEYVDTKKNLYGYGIDILLSDISNKFGYINIIDNDVIVVHPNGTGYNIQEAHRQGDNYLNEIYGKDINYFTNRYNFKKLIDFNGINLKDSVTFIIPNRGGKEITRVINNFQNTFSKYFTRIEFIVIEQDDNMPFMKGQLYNIAIKKCNTEYIGLIDNDSFNINDFNPINIYNSIHGSYVAFDRIAQLTFINDNQYKITNIEARPSGYGVLCFSKKCDLLSCNGYSNLCFNWGREDNILNEKLKLKRYVNVLGHITHKRRNNDNIESLNFNTKIFDLYKSKKISNNLDGLLQTTCEFISEEVINNIKTIKVKNISVIDHFAYKYLYNEAVEKLFNRELIVTMTSWKKRQDNLIPTIKTILNQTKKSNKIVVNLSLEEFPDKFSSLNKNVSEFLQSNSLIEVNWIEGKNTKQWKKIIPTVLKYPDDVIICIDDDRLYGSDFIETLWRKHIENPNNAITVNGAYRFRGKYLQHCGHGTLVCSSFYNGFNGIDINYIINHFQSSDTFFNYMLHKNGHNLIYCGKDSSRLYNEIEPLHETNGTYSFSSHEEMWKYMVNNYGDIYQYKPVTYQQQSSSQVNLLQAFRDDVNVIKHVKNDLFTKVNSVNNLSKEEKVKIMDARRRSMKFKQSTSIDKTLATFRL